MNNLILAANANEPEAWLTLVRERKEMSRRSAKPFTRNKALIRNIRQKNFQRMDDWVAWAKANTLSKTSTTHIAVPRAFQKNSTGYFQHLWPWVAVLTPYSQVRVEYRYAIISSNSTWLSMYMHNNVDEAGLSVLSPVARLVLGRSHVVPGFHSQGLQQPRSARSGYPNGCHSSYTMTTCTTSAVLAAVPMLLVPRMPPYGSQLKMGKPRFWLSNRCRLDKNSQSNTPKGSPSQQTTCREKCAAVLKVVRS